MQVVRITGRGRGGFQVGILRSGGSGLSAMLPFRAQGPISDSSLCHVPQAFPPLLGTCQLSRWQHALFSLLTFWGEIGPELFSGTLSPWSYSETIIIRQQMPSVLVTSQYSI